MDKQWEIQIWGVRGSVPTPAKPFMTYGGNTACVSVSCGTDLIVFDAGSGLTALGKKLKQEKNRKRIDIFLSHFHLDHIMGLFTFYPFYDPEMEIHIYGQDENGDNQGLKQRLNRLLGPPYWPVGFAHFRADITLHPLSAGMSVRLAGQENLPESSGIILHTLSGNHPNGSLLYRMDGAGKRLVYGLDCELTEDIAPAYLQFARGANLLFWDAMYTAQEIKTGWGHSTWEQGADFRQKANIEQVLMMHYNPDYTDSFLSEQEALARKKDTNIQFAREGMTFFLPNSQ